MNRATAGALLAMALLATGAPAPFAQSAPDLDPRIVQLVGQVSEDRLASILRKLETFGTRNTLSAVDASGRGIGAARQWIFDELQSYSVRLQVSYDAYRRSEERRVGKECRSRW